MLCDETREPGGMYKVWMTNFNTVVYEGNDPNKAVEKAIKTGFECTMTHPDGMMSWSPISGWRTIYGNDTSEVTHA